MCQPTTSKQLLADEELAEAICVSWRMGLLAHTLAAPCQLGIFPGITNFTGITMAMHSAQTQRVPQHVFTLRDPSSAFSGQVVLLLSLREKCYKECSCTRGPTRKGKWSFICLPDVRDAGTSAQRNGPMGSWKAAFPSSRPKQYKI